eukprot:Hpha_TRINITY_DN16022_c4_g1::TRINITY_DN16022_c4_g1_i2::g.118674::m.118674/K10380/ANK; ankyrin
MSLPKYQGTVFRAVSYKAPDSLYHEGALVTMPHQSSASEDPAVVKRFLGRGDGGKTGSILIMRTQTARSIAMFSRYPSEKEVLIPANVQFRVVGRPDVGVLQLLESALDTDLSDVAVVEMREVSFEDWGQLPSLLTEIERFVNKPLLDALPKAQCERVNLKSKWTGEGLWRHYPPTTVMVRAGARTLLEYAVDVPRNHSVVSLVIANLDMSLAENRDAASWGLCLAVSKGEIRSSAVLLSRGAPPSTLNPALRVPGVALISALCRLKVAREVMEVLGETFWEKDPGRERQTVLHAAAIADRGDLLGEFLNWGTGKLEIDCVDEAGETPLFAAAKSGSNSALTVLLDRGADKDFAVKKNGQRPCFAAAINGHANTLRLLIARGADVNSGCRDGTTPCSHALYHVDCLKVLATEGGADVNLPAFNPPVIDAAYLSYECLRVLVKELKADPIGLRVCMQLSSPWGSSWSGTIKNGWTPLHSAAGNGQIKSLALLLSLEGVDPNRQTEVGLTPCGIAAHRGYHEALPLLIRKGADVNLASFLGRTPLHISARRGHVDCVKILIREGADLNRVTCPPSVSASGKDPEVERKLQLLQRELGWTPCHYAAAGGHATVLGVLMAAGCDLKIQSAAGLTPCALAAHLDQPECLRILSTTEKEDVDRGSKDGRPSS